MIADQERKNLSLCSDATKQALNVASLQRIYHIDRFFCRDATKYLQNVASLSFRNRHTLKGYCECSEVAVG